MPREIDIDAREKEAFERVLDSKQRFGESLVILGHHYQRMQVIQLSDFIGDSFGLAARAAKAEKAEYIVFCGVEFMAESADIVSAPHQAVFHPNADAGCPMADMASLEDVERSFEIVSRRAAGRVIPLVYMNSSAVVKAFCGRNGGLVCTSSNAQKAMEWAYEQGKVVLFIPDEHLATNTADLLELPKSARTLFDPGHPEGGESFHVDGDTRLVCWKGFCHVHTLFTPEHVAEARERHPDCTVVVHPECVREVTALSDVVGSTTKIVKTVEHAPVGQTVCVGTELNLVERLAFEEAGRKKILPLARSLCPNMFRINLTNLSDTLENLAKETFRVTVPGDVARDARIALERMLAIS